MEGDNSIKFIYLGEDLEFAKGIEKTLNQFYGDLEIKLVKKSFKKNEDAWRFIADKSTLDYALYYVDFSSNYSFYSFVANALGRENSFRDKPLIGLGGVDITRDQVISGLTGGCDAFFIKGIEISGLVNFSMKICRPNDSRPIDWATGEFAEDETDVYVPVKLNYFTENYIHVETDVEFEMNSEVVVKTKICDEMGIEKFRVVRNSQEDFYYNFKNNYDLEYITPVRRMDLRVGIKNPDEKEDEEPLSEKAVEKLDIMKVDIGAWVEKHQHMSTPKSTKVLIVDQELTFLKQIDQSLEDYPFSILFHRYLKEDMETIKRSKADIVVLALDEHFEDKEDGYSNTIEILPKLIKKAKEIEGYTPFIFIFNSKFSGEELKKKNEYEKIVSTSEEFDFNKVLDLVKKFELAGGDKLTCDPKYNFGDKEERFYISKRREDSFALHPFKVKIKQINEMTITIQTTYKLKPFTVLKLDFPTECFISILPREKEDKLPEKQGFLYNYNAAIHSIGEVEKNQLRVYINKVFVPKEEEPEEDT
ncbi:MAG: hypothetical protein DRQ88_10455 [Epsilonproteobacteria bacterium]|nr:MAG: hypothetical protein DRQ88_10455 [Campylobacterota bacterium]RLA65832.1 MAG: hypothetical protein DRQ89_00335 [Campylobacterota bacterium]